jgi:hypothetical protein
MVPGMSLSAIGEVAFHWLAGTLIVGYVIGVSVSALCVALIFEWVACFIEFLMKYRLKKS